MITTRGTILAYDGATGKGIVSASGEKFPFDIAQWSSDHVPKVGAAVDVARGDDGGVTITPVAAAADMVSKINVAAVTGFIQRDAKEMAVKVGLPVIAAYLVFFFGSIIFKMGELKFVNFGQVIVLDATYFQIIGFSGFLRLLFILSLLSIAVPYFWKDSRAWLAYIMPLVVLILSPMFAGSSRLEPHLNELAREKVGSAASYLLKTEPTSAGFSFGFYLMIAAAIYLAWLGFRRFRQKQPVYENSRRAAA